MGKLSYWYIAGLVQELGGNMGTSGIVIWNGPWLLLPPVLLSSLNMLILLSPPADTASLKIH